MNKRVGFQNNFKMRHESLGLSVSGIYESKVKIDLVRNKLNIR